MTHNIGMTKCGSVASSRSLNKMCDKEIEFIKTAHHPHDSGYWVLMFVHPGSAAASGARRQSSIRS